MRKLYILVEGDDDRRFIEKIIQPKLVDRGFEVKLIAYATKSKKIIRGYVKSFGEMDVEYQFIHDYDNDTCITKKKQDIKNIYPFLDENNILIVKEEIESWYLAGLDSGFCQRKKIKFIPNTEIITKEKFNNIVTKKAYKAIREAKIDILDNYSIDTAKTKNATFNYYMGKYIE